MGTEPEESESSEQPIAKVPIAKLRPGSGQPRKSFNEASLDELAASIREQGILQPILVERRGDEYSIVAGERRYRASLKAGLTEIPVIVRSFSEQERLQIALVENIQREDLTPIEEAEAYRALMNSLAVGQEELAQRLGKNRSTVANSLRLLNLPPEMQEAVSGGKMSAGHGRALLSVQNPADRDILFRRVVDNAISVREAEAAAEELNGGKRAAASKKQKKSSHRPAELIDLEQKLIDRLGTKVAVHGTLKKGTIEMSYYSAEDLDRLFELLLKGP